MKFTELKKKKKKSFVHLKQFNDSTEGLIVTMIANIKKKKNHQLL